MFINALISIRSIEITCHVLTHNREAKSRYYLRMVTLYVEIFTHCPYGHYSTIQQRELPFPVVKVYGIEGTCTIYRFFSGKVRHSDITINSSSVKASMSTNRLLANSWQATDWAWVVAQLRPCLGIMNTLKKIILMVSVLLSVVMYPSNRTRYAKPPDDTLEKARIEVRGLPVPAWRPLKFFRMYWI